MQFGDLSLKGIVALEVFNLYLIVPHCLLHQVYVWAFLGNCLEYYLIGGECVAGELELANIAFKREGMKVHCTRELYVCLHRIEYLCKSILLLNAKTLQTGQPIGPLHLLHVVDVEVRCPDALDKLLVNVDIRPVS